MLDIIAKQLNRTLARFGEQLAQAEEIVLEAEVEEGDLSFKFMVKFQRTRRDVEAKFRGEE